MTNKTEATADPPATASNDNLPEMPEEIDFSRGLRGQTGHEILVQLARYRRALLTVRDTPDIKRDPLQAARTMQEVARKALAEGSAA
jgi:hypothetical protein